MPWISGKERALAWLEEATPHDRRWALRAAAWKFNQFPEVLYHKLINSIAIRHLYGFLSCGRARAKGWRLCISFTYEGSIVYERVLLVPDIFLTRSFPFSRAMKCYIRDNIQRAERAAKTIFPEVFLHILPFFCSDILSHGEKKLSLRLISERETISIKYSCSAGKQRTVPSHFG